MNPIGEAFVVGVIVTASFTCSLFFVRFWLRTRDLLFLAFELVFFTEGATRVILQFTVRPNESSPGFYVARMLAYLMLVVAIIRKNYA